MSFDYHGIRHHIYVHHENYRGGVNNLFVADIYKDGGVWCGAGAMSSPVTTGTSEHGKEQAIRNAMRNFRRRNSIGTSRLVRKALRRV